MFRNTCRKEVVAASRQMSDLENNFQRSENVMCTCLLDQNRQSRRIGPFSAVKLQLHRGILASKTGFCTCIYSLKAADQKYNKQSHRQHRPFFRREVATSSRNLRVEAVDRAVDLAASLIFWGQGPGPRAMDPIGP